MSRLLIELTYGDTQYPLILDIYDDGGNVADLNNVESVTFKFTPRTGGATISKTGSVHDVAGKVKWQQADADFGAGQIMPGYYTLQIQVAWTGGKKFTFPSGLDADVFVKALA